VHRGQVAVAGNGSTRVMTSPDGINWTAQTSPASNNWTGVTYGGPTGNKLYVAVSFNGVSRVMTSATGTGT
jgi:hypothetical protein